MEISEIQRMLDLVANRTILGALSTRLIVLFYLSFVLLLPLFHVCHTNEMVMLEKCRLKVMLVEST